MDFTQFWSKLNEALDAAGHAQAPYGEAKFWFGRKFLPETAAELIATERELEGVLA